MANFHTHITYAAAASGLLSVLCLQVGLITQNEALLLALTGTIGGILPDIDLQRSYPSQILFSLLGIIVAFAMIFLYKSQLTIVELWLLGILMFTGIRYPLWKLFNAFTTHRGSIHSLVAAVFATFSTTAITYHLFDIQALVSWLFGFFIGFGFIIHLLLDELYSVDFTNRRLKRSFGSAFKLVDSRKPFKTLLLVSMTALVWWITPSSDLFWDTLMSPATYQIIAYRFMPDYLTNWIP